MKSTIHLSRVTTVIIVDAVIVRLYTMRESDADICDFIILIVCAFNLRES